MNQTFIIVQNAQNKQNIVIPRAKIEMHSQEFG